jgi:hypothetical protein
MAESSRMIIIIASLEEGLMKRHKRASKTLQNKKRNAITACSFEMMQLFNNTGYLLLQN